ncbi:MULTISPECIES: PAS domain-containing protein [unclassified Methylobacterium]|uniref:PAS domain-containing protein n=1 Tax=unclassified Methylobacterium TaxID=2615210 RepID=UPI0012E7A24F|nr:MULTISPECIES: PAS domain-containing protein [unclassified Methylobacterium]
MSYWIGPYQILETRVGRIQTRGTQVSQIMLQQALDASDLIGRWEYDVAKDLAYADALVALVFNIDPTAMAAGVALDVFLAGVHPEDRERFADEIVRSMMTGICCTFEYRVCSADGVVRWVLDRGRITLDEAGRPQRGSGVLIDITQSRVRDHEANPVPDFKHQHPLERAAEHCLAAQEAIHELPEPLLHRMSDMLLLEVGRALSKLTDARRRGSMN